MECRVCLNMFGEEFIPKSLECGHSLCNICLCTLMEKDPACPTCLHPFLKHNITEYPTNFLVLKLINKVEDLNFKYDSQCSMNLNPTIYLKDFENMIDFLYEIYMKIQCGEKVFAVGMVNGKVRCGRMVIFGNRILLQSLTQERESEQEITTVLFREVKQCAFSLKLTPFLKVSCNRKGLEEIALIETSDHPLVPHFVKLCTGEGGPCYKGRSYIRGKNIKKEFKFVFNVLDVSEVESRDVDCDFKPAVLCEEGELVVYGWKKGDINMIKMVSDKTYNNIIGKVVQPCSLDETICFRGFLTQDRNRIVESGISFTLK